MTKFIFSLLLMVLSLSLMSQATVPDWTVTDSKGVDHTLYADYLDKGTTVVLKLFFVDCPPCNSLAPHMQTLYEDWGEGAEDVEFMEMTISGDDDAELEEYKAKHSLTFPGISIDGGAAGAVRPYLDDEFFNFSGTPTVAVIAPDGTVVKAGGFSISARIEKIGEAIEATGATGGITPPPPPPPAPAIYTLAIEDVLGNEVNGIEAVIYSESDPAISYDINLGAGTSLTITDLETEFPGIADPILQLSKNDEVRKNLTPLDILLIRKHILQVNTLTDPALLMAADTNGDGNVTPLDMLVLRKVILDIFQEFPVNSHRFLPNDIPLSVVAGQNQTFEIKVSKTGDLNGF